MRPAKYRITLLLSAVCLLGTSLPAQAGLADIPLVGNFLAWGAELVGFPVQPATSARAPRVAPVRTQAVAVPPPADLTTNYPNFDETPAFAGNPGDSGFGQTVNPPPRAVKGVSASNGGTQPLRWPVNSRAGGGNTLVSAYGTRWLSGGENTHYGIDINVPVGTPVMAPFNGRILSVSPACHDQGGPTRGGCQIAILRDDGIMVSYAHLSAINVKPGQQVVSGMTLAHSGHEGTLSEGAHLHMSTCRIAVSTRLGTSPAAACTARGSQRIDPVSVLSKDDPRYREAQLLKGYQQERIACHQAARGNVAKSRVCETHWQNQTYRLKAMARNRDSNHYEIARAIPLSVLQGCAAEARTGRITYDACLRRNKGGG